MAKTGGDWRKLAEISGKCEKLADNSGQTML
nr:MAG TPA: hypothetical protein [Caudoviricetes sp.]